MFGILFGYVTLKSRKLGAFAIGACLGYFLSLLIYTAFLFHYESEKGSVSFLINLIKIK